MTRAYQVVTKTVQKKSSSPFDLQYSSKRNNDVIFKLPLTSQTSPNTVCLSGLLSDLTLSKSSHRKRFWGQIYTRSQRCVHLASLLEQHSSDYSITTSASSTSSTSSASDASSSARSSALRQALTPLPLNQNNDHNPISSSFPPTLETVCTATGSEVKKLNKVKHQKFSFPFMTKIDNDNATIRNDTSSSTSQSSSSSSSWGYFVEEAEDESTNNLLHQLNNNNNVHR